MVKIFFWGVDFVYDRSLGKKIRTQLKSILSHEDSAEFWFYGMSMADTLRGLQSFSSICMQAALEMKSKYPQKDLKIISVRITHGEIKGANWYARTYNSLFPACLADKTVWAPEIGKQHGYKYDFDSQEFLHIAKTERWILQQCDFVFLYHYPQLRNLNAENVPYAKRRPDLTVVLLDFPQTRTVIQQKIAAMDARTRNIMKRLSDGESSQKIGKSFGIAESTVRGIAQHTAYALHRNLASAMKNQEPFNRMVRTCGFAGIGEADAFKLSAFEGLIEFMTREFDVRGFVVNQSDCDSMYAIVLAKLVAQRGAPYWSKAVVHKAQWSASERKKASKRYCPPFSELVTVADKQADSFLKQCAEVIRISHFFVTNLKRNAKYAEQIKTLCAQSKHTVLIDLSNVVK